MVTLRNRRWIVAAVPQSGPLPSECFRLEESLLPDLKEGEYLVKNELISFDPTQRIWLTADSYVPKIPLGTVMRSLGLGTVVASRCKGLAEGTRVSGLFGWQDYALRSGKDLFPDTVVPAGIESAAALSVFGMTGLTAYFGMQEVGQIKAGDTVLVSGASGATGSIAVQIAKLRGAKKVIGIAGSSAKCRWLLDTAKIDAAIDYKHEDLSARLRSEAPEGIDLYFDNVGGSMLDLALSRLRQHGRVVLCGAISTYEGSSSGAISNYMSLVINRGVMRGFLVFDYAAEAPVAIAQMAEWIKQGRLRYEVDMQEGLENAPQTLQRLFSGMNLGKQLLRI